jgi:PAS domain S-box-containing protein
MTQPRILIVEDDPDTARLLEIWLRSSHFQHIGTARTGQEAITLASSTRPDLVIMDIVLPGDLDGIQTAGILQTRFDVPVLYLTAYSDEALFERARATSPSAYLTKPFSDRELKRAVEVALDRHDLLIRLKASEAHLAEAQAVAHIGSWRWDLQQDQVEASAELLRLLDLSPGTFEPRFDSFLQRVSADDQPEVLQTIATLLNGDDPGEFDVSIPRGNDHPRMLRVRCAVRFNDIGQAFELVGTARDVTNEWMAHQEADLFRNQLEETHRRESEEQYRAIIQASMDGFLVANIQGQILDCNDAICRTLGYTREEMLQLTIPELDHGKSPEQVAEHIRQIIERGQDRFETRDLHKNGQLIDIEVSAYYRPDSSGGKLFSFVRDITQRKQAEIALRESEENLELAQSISHIGSWHSDLAYKFKWSDELYRIYGVSPETFTPNVETLINLIHPADQPAMQAWINTCASGQQAGTLEFRCVWPDGTIRHISGQGKLMLDAHGKPSHMAGTAQDITTSKQAEQERLAHEAKLRNVLVREVHHRIKNNLQGVIGLLRKHITSHPDTRPTIEAAIAQINTVAVVHGLQSRIPQNELSLRELLHEVSGAAAALAMVPQLPDIADTLSGEVWLDSSASVSIALILNELIHNALKHNSNADGSGVELSLAGNTQRVAIHICNPNGPLPENLNLATGHGCGTGLGLVRTLLPRRGAILNFYESNGRITAEFVLSPPVTSTHGHVVRTSSRPVE